MKKVIYVDVDKDMIENALYDYLVAKGKIPDTALYFSETSLIFFKERGGIFLSNLIDMNLSVIVEDES
jgi:hypothetical protein